MRITFKQVTGLVFIALLMSGCASSKSRIMEGGSQVELRSYQTRSYESESKLKAMRAVMATLQDLGFVIDKADDVIGIVSATKLDGYALQMSVSVRERSSSVEVRANAQYNLQAVEDREPYQNFFTALDKAIFLDENL
ncbi:hypothetical protein K0504_16770 [Neiella marina]|uniref:Uncharacterized protein n=1 Tax=Neiella holothuriorum TaxID=2870530 RepID=A0ABS7EK08_9GAMM|nr:hypothetical protein [Neiella holothuriorum]MBW8192692.1 hypothetical protein [Neiella holothuriorum]